VGEEVFAAVIRRNETKTFCVIEPFDSTDCHVCNFLTKNDQIPGLPDSLVCAQSPGAQGNLDCKLNPNRMLSTRDEFSRQQVSLRRCNNFSGLRIAKKGL